MRLRHIPGCEEFVANSKSVQNEPQLHRGHWCEVFHNNNPLYIEVGMGKGRFIRDMSELNPGINFLGIERYESVLQKAIERKESREAELAQMGKEVPANLFFLNIDAAELATAFAPQEVSRIYLNFSDPWPKARHALRRLTSPLYMKVYDQILARDGQLEFKTDNNSLFEYSLESISESGWQIVYETRDLHATPEAHDNVMTEYEEKFSSKGQNICKLIAKR